MEQWILDCDRPQGGLTDLINRKKSWREAAVVRQCQAFPRHHWNAAKSQPVKVPAEGFKGVPLPAHPFPDLVVSQHANSAAASGYSALPSSQSSSAVLGDPSIISPSPHRVLKLLHPGPAWPCIGMKKLFSVQRSTTPLGTVATPRYNPPEMYIAIQLKMPTWEAPLLEVDAEPGWWITECPAGKGRNEHPPRRRDNHV